MVTFARPQPQYNVRFKDDKSYPYIKVTLADDFPRIERTRKLPNGPSLVQVTSSRWWTAIDVGR